MSLLPNHHNNASSNTAKDAVIQATNGGHFKALYVVLLAVPVGGVSGLIGVSFRYAIEFVTQTLYGTGQDNLATTLSQLAFWQIALPLLAAGLAVGLLNTYLMPQGRMHNPADVLYSTMYKNGRMSGRAGIGVFVGGALSMGAGASVGIFGPAITMGATMGAKVAEFLRLNRQMSLAILAASFGAIISASFNTPIAGTFFALEFVLGSYALANFAPVVMASLAATAVSRFFFGNVFAFDLPNYDLAPISHAPLFVVLGALCTVGAVALIDLTVRIARLYERFHIAPLWRPMIGGAILACMIYVMPEIAGFSTQGSNQAMMGLLPIGFMALFLVFKVVGTSVTLGSGFGGGIFAPAITCGILIGGIFGFIITQMGLEGNLRGYYSLIATGAVTAVVMGAPIATILIIFEMSGDYSLTFGVMITTVVSSQLAHYYYGHSFFTKLLAGRGIQVNFGREEMLLRGIKARNLMRTTYSTLPTSATLAEMRVEFTANECTEIFIVDDGMFMGIVTPNSVGDALYNGDKDKSLRAKDVLIPPPACVTPDTNIAHIMPLMDQEGDQNLPVLEPLKGQGVTQNISSASISPQKIVGVLMENDVLMAYRTIVQETRSHELR